MVDSARRSLLTGALAWVGGVALSPSVAARRRQSFPPDFLWGTAISAYQSEGNNTNSDSWISENVTPTLFKERSGDACDSYHRYAEDIALAARLGFNCYRMGLEWARIEPSPGAFSHAELDHYARVLETCRTFGLRPVVTFNHFTVPIWFAARGGFETADAPEIFARYCGRVGERLGPLMHLATTFNEANIQQLLLVMPGLSGARRAAAPMIAAAAHATGSPAFSRLAYADPAVTTPCMQEAHRRGYRAIKAARPDLPVGLTLTTQDIQPLGPNSLADQYRDMLYGGWLDVAREAADFIGLQTYTRILVDARGPVPPPKGAELTASGYEYYPQALANTIRWAHATVAKPIYVTENGIGTDDDRRRIAFIDQALAGLSGCLRDGIPVHSYLFWSLLDNFEWTAGYGVHFGLVAVDRATFRRTPKPSAFHLGAIARANRI